jgi:hypothetical protein
MVIKPRNVYKTGIKPGRDEHLKYNKSKVTQIYKDLAQCIKGEIDDTKCHVQ